MICIDCGTDNSNTIEAADGYIYCIECGVILNDCCYCGVRKGTAKVRDIEVLTKDEALMFCDFCAEYVRAINEIDERKVTK